MSAALSAGYSVGCFRHFKCRKVWMLDRCFVVRRRSYRIEAVRRRVDGLELSKIVGFGSRVGVEKNFGDYEWKK